MPPKNPVNASVRPVTPHRSGAERRAAEVAAIAGKQAQLKREAAERRAERTRREAEALPQPPKSTARRRRSR